jgi:osmoprotectant transport system permease protein
VRALLLAIALVPVLADADSVLRIGSKRFTESYILGQILAQSARAAGAAVDYRAGMGNTGILYEALRSGAIDVYPEYTGTIAREILKSGAHLDLAELNASLAPLGLHAGDALGFDDTYALGMRTSEAKRLGIHDISDLARHPGLRLGFSHEFLGRPDGWPGLRRAYRLPQATPLGLDHGLAYDALRSGEVDVIDLYSTDAKIERDHIRVLADDRHFFPVYKAVLLYRSEAPRRVPAAFAAFARLAGTIDAQRMIRLNARAEIDHVPFATVAAEFLGHAVPSRERGLWSAVFAPDFGRLLAEHLVLVFASLAAAVLAGIPLGVLAAKVGRLAQPVLAATGLVQTVPSLALLAALIPLTGTIGLWPALIALFLYALLPIVRNTHAGLAQTPVGLLQAALALGLRPATILARIELPLAARTILAGVKTSAVINVGTATIAAFIGAGGFGERIVQGLALNDNTMLLAGALPAAALALVVHLAFELLERSVAPGR